MTLVGGQMYGPALEALDALERFTLSRLAKVSTEEARRARERAQDEGLDDFIASLAAYFAAFARRAGIPEPAEDVRKARLPQGDIRDFDPEVFIRNIAWGDEAALLEDALGPDFLRFLTAGRSQAESDLGITLRGLLDLGDYDLSIRDQIGLQIRRITESSRDQVRGTVLRGIERGLSQRDIVRGTEGFRGLASIVQSWGSPIGRARVIALTESANAYNLGQLNGYEQSGVVEEVRIFDGTDCGWNGHDDPDLANGSIRSLEEARLQPTSHPNCQRAWAPFIEAP